MLLAGAAAGETAHNEKPIAAELPLMVTFQMV
jgi:hypothetical protein